MIRFIRGILLVPKKKKNKKERYISYCFFFLGGLFFIFSSLTALDPRKAVTQYLYDSWQTERGLEQNSARIILQGSNGYIWLGTLEGLIRFDGIRFKTFNKENTADLQDNVIKALLEDRDGYLWIGTAGGGLTRLKNGKFYTYSLETYPELKEISAIFEDRTRTLWVGTSNSGVTRIKNGEFKTYTTKNGLASNIVCTFRQDQKGRLWIATPVGISIFEPPGKFFDFKIKNDRFNKYTTAMCDTKKGELWLGCLDGLYCLQNNTLNHFGKKDGLPNPRIMFLYEDSSQNLWVSTEGGGLTRVKNGRFDRFPPGHRLASGYIPSIHEDRGNSLWIGSFRNGLHRLRDTTIVSYTTTEGLSHNIVRCIAEDRGGRLWIGTQKGLNRLNNGQITGQWFTKQGLSSDYITAIMEDSKGTLWIGTYKGLNRYKNGKMETFNYGDGFSYKNISEFGEDKRGVVWILTPGKLIGLYQGKSIVTLDKKDFGNHTLVCLFIDQKGATWIGTYGGGIYRLKDDTLSVFTSKDGLVHDDVEAIYEDEKGVLYIGTRGGLSCLKAGKFVNYTTKNGLIESYIYHILEDEAGYLWLTGRIGFSRTFKQELFDFANGKPDKIKPDLFNESDGIKNPMCDQCIKTRDGRLWFATDEGVVEIDPSKLKKSTSPVPVVIEELLADGASVHLSGNRHYREKAPLTIPPGKKRLEFYYTGLSFVKSRQIKFKIKLEGYDSNWIDKSFTRSTTYTGLPPGKYTFRVTACNSDGVWNQEGTSLSFYLKPYFSQTPWFWFLVVLFVLLTIFTLYRFRVRQLKTREKELGKLVELRTSDLKERNIELEKARQNIQHSKELIEEKNLKLESQTLQLKDQSEKLKEMDKVKSRFFANISHEFRTPLTLIMGPLEQMITACSENEREKKRKITLMLRNAQRLLRLINQLLELSKLDSGKMKLQAEKINIISFLKGIIDSFRFMAHQKEMELGFQPETEIEDESLYIEPRKMEDVMSNLLVNAFKFTPPGGKITVTVKKNLAAEENFPTGSLEISVCDTGPGIPADQLAHIFDRFYQADANYEYHEKGSGIGLALSKELVELHHGTIEVRSQEGEGSVFIIRLPMGINHLAPDEIAHIPAAQTQPPTDSKISEKITEMEGVTEKEIESEAALEPEEKTDETDIILVVEDSADMRSYIRGALEPCYTVVDAKDGREGIEKAKVIIPDLIISDIMMPEKDGYELCSVLKNDVKTSHIPIIMLTAKASEENILHGLETGADDYITKPFNTKILIARIKNLIEIRSQLQKNINREMTLQPVKTSISKIDREFLHDLHEVINKNLSDEEFNVERLCKRLYMSRTTLYRKVHALTGETPTDFIRSYRLKRGAELLKQNFGTVLEVAFEVGFSNSSYFAKCFKEKFHQLPSTYQASESE